MKPLLSVIIPMYGVEKFIAKCLDSIIAQSYSNLEIICVNDGTKDNSAVIAEDYSKKDNRIKVLHNPENLGLFRARVEGIKIASGDYIAFVDADDYIGVDWFRLLIKKATDESADMVIGNTVNVDETGKTYFYNNYRSLTKTHKTLYGKEILDKFYEQEGSNFIWHTVWNKVYSRALVERCMPYFLKVNFHMIMGEDIAFSSVFYTHAKILSFANADCYFYYRHSEASTSLSLPPEKIIRNILDLKKVFDFVENSLSVYSPELYEDKRDSIAVFKARYQRTWRGNLWAAGIQNNSTALDAMENTFGARDGELPRPHDFYFYELTAPWTDKYEMLKKLIVSDTIDVVSFDIFDTLVYRPFYDPADILNIIAPQVSKLLPSLSVANFFKIRKDADIIARKRSSLEDITLTNIYDTFAELYHIDNTIARKIQRLEEEAEIRYCSRRETAKELYDLALTIGKKIVITSDMYLERDTISTILAKNGYDGYHKLYLSSELLALKSTGKLFKYVVSDLRIAPKKILHIGDTWNVDIVKANEVGLQTFFLPKAIETMENGISDIYAGGAANAYKQKWSIAIDSTYVKSQLPISTAIALIANKSFDNPYETFSYESAYNGNASYMGYSALGLHLLGLAEWMYNVSLERGYEKIVFFARDGKMLKEVFDYLCKARGTDISTEYIYATRKALMPYSIKCPADLYEINKFMDVKAHCPRDILKLFAEILNTNTDQIAQQYKKMGVDLDENLEKSADYYKFIDAMVKISYNESIRAEKFEQASAIFRKVFTEKTATFDLGYSGRLQKIVCDLSGHPINTFYLHSNGYNTDVVTDNGFAIHSFLEYTPTISGIVREFLMSEPTPSCYAYDFSSGVIVPKIEASTENFSYEAVYAIKEFQAAGVRFCKDYIDIFGNEFEGKTVRPYDYSVMFDYFLVNAASFDRYVFSNAMVEDEVYGGYSAKSIFDIWSWHVSMIPAASASYSAQLDSLPAFLDKNGAGKLKKAIAYLLFDRATFKAKFKNKFKNHKIILGASRFSYRALKKVYHIFKGNKTNKV